MIEFSNVSKGFESRKILKDVDFTIRDGEIFVIIGQSGAGKTTILRHIAGFYDPDNGDVVIDSVKMNGASNRIRKKLREKMGFLFQGGALLNWLNVRDNIGLPLVEHRLASKDEIARIVDEKLALLQLTDAADKMPSEISGGMKKRVGLARAIVRNPEIILYDEPTSGLDPVMSARIDELILRMKRELGVTSVVVTHDMNSAYRIADRIAMLYSGEMVQIGTPDEIRTSESGIVQQFISGNIHGPIKP